MFHGSYLPDLISTLLFVSSQVNAAKRFTNGKWQDIGLVSQLVDKFISKAGWVPMVAEHYLILCERAIEYYSVEKFADNILSIIANDLSAPISWKGTIIPARIAGLIQFFAESNQPLEPPLAQKLLHILDTLIDIGDRRSAALQNSEIFRNINNLAEENY